MKNKFIAAALLAATAFPAAASTGNFMKGASIGLTAGMHSTGLKQIKGSNFSGFVPALNFDYYFTPGNNGFFLGTGLEASYSFGQKKLSDGNASVSFSKTWSTGAKLAAGFTANSVAFEGNVAILATNFKANIKETYRGRNYKATGSDVLFGIAPGAAVHFAVAKNMTLGINYRYEMYNISGLKTGLRSHVVGVKLAYKL